MRGHWLRVEDVAALLGSSNRSIHELTRLRRIPFRKIEGTRRCLFREDEVLAWIDSGGTLALEVVEGERGGVVVRLANATEKNPVASSTPREEQV